MNQVSMIGRLTRDPERFRTKDSESYIVRFTLAFTDSGRSVFVPVICFGRVGEVVVEYLHKGAQVAVAGRLTNRIIEMKDGTRTTVAVICDKVDFLQTGSTDKAVEEQAMEELPF